VSQSLRVSRIHVAALIDTGLWRALAFARSLQENSPWVARQLRRTVLVLRWTATFQLHVHARLWLQARRLRRAAPVVAPVAIIDAVNPRCLIVPFSADPVVSVIVPTYGQVQLTLKCLSSIADQAPELPIEVIVVDDAWNGSGAQCLEQVPGIRLIRNETNLGYLHSCNKAAAAARGHYLLFLNNDTEVSESWLEPMVSLFHQRPGTGAVGAKLLNPDGSLQEAGGIIWQDASGWNFGRLEDPSKPAYNYVREVDYCSAAALMVERQVFANLGGFDKIYAPAYFEDADLCFRLRRIGLKTLYQPAARVVHHEGMSHGRDTSVGIKSYQVANQRAFVSRWADILAHEHFRNGNNVFRARDRAMHREVVLVIDHYVPTPDRDAGSRVIVTWLEVLLQAGFVVKFWPHNLSYSPNYTEALQDMGVEVFYGPGQPAFETWIKQVGGEIDTVLVSRPEVAEDVMPSIRRHSKARVIYYGVDLHFERMGLQAEVMRDDRMLRAAANMRDRECAIWRQADLSLYLSEEEARTASALEPDSKVESVVPYCFDQFAMPRAAPKGEEIIFVAGFGHPPNEDAALWFVHEILPLIHGGAPRAHLSIIGSNPTPRVRALAADGIAVFADVSATGLAAAYARARVAVVPLRCGAGVKLKVVEALSAGLPLVTTPVGAQGLPALSTVVAVECNAASFAAAVVSLLHDDVAWVKRRREQVEYAQARFSRAALTASLLKALGVTHQLKPGQPLSPCQADNHLVPGPAVRPSATPSGSNLHLQLLQHRQMHLDHDASEDCDVLGIVPGQN
jgi:O-antigen biosynthesis protein